MKTAVILAGGKGTRLAEIRSDVPKPMMPVLDKPLLAYQIELLKAHGFTKVWVPLPQYGSNNKSPSFPYNSINPLAT